MSDFQFEEEGIEENSRFKSRAILGQMETPKMAKFLLNIGIVKSPAGAQNILLGITITCITLTGIVVAYNMFKKPKVVAPVNIYENLPQEVKEKMRPETRERFQKIGSPNFQNQ